MDDPLHLHPELKGCTITPIPFDCRTLRTDEGLDLT